MRGLGLLIVGIAWGCSGSAPDVAYGPYRSLVEIVAEIDSAVDADLYRFDPPLDVTGENLFRASLNRLEQIESIVGDPALLPAIQFARAEARERLLDFAGAAELYESVARGSSGLAERANDRAPFARRIADLTAPLAEGALPLDLLGAIDRQRVQLVEERTARKDDPRRCLVDCAIERLDVRRREFLWRNRSGIPDGTNRALSAAEKVTQYHAESRRVLEHLLRLGDAYTEILSSQLAAVDPHDHAFDAARAQNLMQAAAQVYATVAAVDGRPEREEARASIAKLEAMGMRWKPRVAESEP